MAAVEWYYAKGNEQHGPVSSAELKQLAVAGQVDAEDLVWREGMEDWIAARKVKGLFDDAGGPAAAAPAAPKAAPAEIAPEPAEAAAPAAARPSGPAFDQQPAPAERKPRPRRERTGRHLFDIVLDLLRAQFPAPAIDAAAEMFTLVGHFGMYAAMGLCLIVSLLMAAKGDVLSIMLLGLGGVMLLAVLQYAAAKFVVSLSRLNRGSPGSVNSTAFLDCFALFCVVLGVAALVGLAVVAIQTETYGMILTGLLAFIFLEYTAFVALSPESVHVHVEPGIRAGQEAIGVLTFLLKTLLKLAPVAFGAGVAVGTLKLAYAGYLAMAQSPHINPAVYFTEATMSVIRYAAVPVAVYLVFLLYYLFVDVIGAVLSLPGKLDKLSGGHDEGEA